ncbi:MAG: SH3 domain-containing protein [Erysipelotrichaceae bacterium]|nr:SH3 domain-containing protein [Erysipelotrichaceae bacterium]
MNILKKTSSKIVVIILAIILIIGIVYYSKEDESSVLVLLNDTIEVEYGNTISLEAKDYIDTKQIDEEIISSIQVTTDAINETQTTTNEDGEDIVSKYDYPPVGEYTVTISYKQEQAFVNVNVVDTTAPIFDNVDSTYTLEKGSNMDLSNISTSDLSDVTISINDENVDYENVGSYKATIIATDSYENKTEVEITIEIVTGENDSDESTSAENNTTDITFTDVNETVYVINTSTLNIRSGASTSYSQIGTLSKGTSVKRTGTSDAGWSRIEYNGQTAYASSKYLSTTKPSTTSSNTSSSSSSSSTSAGFDVSSLKVASSTNKIIIVSVSSTSSSNGSFKYYEKSNGTWKTVISTTANLGQYGIGKTREGDRKTPTGTYHFSKLMGIASNPGTIMSYTQITSSMYWCGGENYYNQLVDESVSTHDCDKTKDEHLIDYSPGYKYLAVINYNSSNVYNKGSAIFLHCKTSSPNTDGCIAISESEMKKMMTYIDSSTVIIIDTENNIKSKY